MENLGKKESENFERGAISEGISELAQKVKDKIHEASPEELKKISEEISKFQSILADMGVDFSSEPDNL